MTWPPDIYGEIRRRYKLAYSLRGSPKDQMIANDYYRTHPVEWMQDWGITFDPRNEGEKLIPFIPFPRQIEFVHYLHELYTTRESGLVEKCRDVGATWLACLFSVWLWRYHPGATIGWGSRKEEYVDDSMNPKAIFPKIRQIIENLPSWQIPLGFSFRSHATYMKIINPENGASITGEAGDGIGRGGRTSIYFKDESAHYERPEKIEASLGDNTDVQVDISSVNGSANVFYRRRMAGEVWSSGCKIEHKKTRVFIFDWRDHPGKTQEWYDARRKKAEGEGLLHVFAQEVDRDYQGSTDKIIIRGEWIRAAIDAHLKLQRAGNWHTGVKAAGQDVADGGGDKNALAIRHGSVLKLIEGWGGEAQEAAKYAVPLCLDQCVTEIYYDCIGVGAGFKAQANTMRESGALPSRIKVMPWDASASPLEPERPIIPNDRDSPKNADHFLNMKAQAWWRLRTRFYKTYRAVLHGEEYPADELISLESGLPHLHQLEMELTQAEYAYNQAGKMLVDKRPNGALSPNLADAVVMCYCRPHATSSLFDV